MTARLISILKPAIIKIEIDKPVICKAITPNEAGKAMMKRKLESMK